MTVPCAIRADARAAARHLDANLVVEAGGGNRKTTSCERGLRVLESEGHDGR